MRRIFLTLMLLVVASSAQAVLYMYDDFETGASSNTWQYSVLGVGSSSNVATAYKAHGSYGFREVSGSGNDAYIGRNNHRASVYLRGYFRLPSGTISGMSDGNFRGFFKIEANFSLTVLLYKQSGTVNLWLWNAYATGQQASISVAEDTWYCIEVYAPPAGNPVTAKWWIDGNAQTDITGLNVTGDWIDQIYGWKAGSGTSAMTVWMDDILVGDSYNGTIADAIVPGRIKSRVTGGIIE